MEGLKISNVWENFDYFVMTVNSVGRNESKAILKPFVLNIADLNIDWKKLFKTILFICRTDKRVFKRFDYPEDRIEQIRKSLMDSNMMDQLFDKMISDENVYIDQKGNIIPWNSENKFYYKTHEIYLSNSIDSGENKIVKILGVDNSTLTFGEYREFLVEYNNIKIKLIFKTSDGKFQYAINTETNRKVLISTKYPEILYFISIYYFDIDFDNLSLNRLEYLIKSFCFNEIRVPTINQNAGLKSNFSSQILRQLEPALKYLKYVNDNFKNIVYTYRASKYGSLIRFDVIRPDDDKNDKLIMDIQKQNSDKFRKFQGYKSIRPKR